jgi:hypothetical protein
VLKLPNILNRTVEKKREDNLAVVDLLQLQNLLKTTVEKERIARVTAIDLLTKQNRRESTAHKARKDGLKAKLLPKKCNHVATICSPLALAKAKWQKIRKEVSSEEYARLKRNDRNSKERVKHQQTRMLFDLRARRTARTPSAVERGTWKLIGQTVSPEDLAQFRRLSRNRKQREQYAKKTLDRNCKQREHYAKNKQETDEKGNQGKSLKSLGHTTVSGGTHARSGYSGSIHTATEEVGTSVIPAETTSEGPDLNLPWTTVHTVRRKAAKRSEKWYQNGAGPLLIPARKKRRIEEPPLPLPASTDVASSNDNVQAVSAAELPAVRECGPTADANDARVVETGDNNDDANAPKDMNNDDANAPTDMDIEEKTGNSPEPVARSDAAVEAAFESQSCYK